MEKRKEELYKNIKDLITKKNFEEDIKNRLKEYDGLLDEDSIALLIVDELGRNKQNVIKIKDLEPGIESTIFGHITKIDQLRTFNRKNGSTGRVINLEIADDTGSCCLALWDKDVELVKNKTIKLGTNVKIINGYIKEGFRGTEINVGRWGLIETEPKDIPEKIEKLEVEENKIKGKLTEIDPTRAFFKDDGEFGFVTNIKLESKGDVKQITIWGEKVKEIQNLKPGNIIEIENIDIKNKNGKIELHMNSKGVIKRL